MSLRTKIVVPMVATTYEDSKSVTFSGDCILTSGADGVVDTKFAMGAALGSGKKKGLWKAYYEYRVVEAHVVVSRFAQDDFLLQTIIAATLSAATANCTTGTVWTSGVGLGEGLGSIESGPR